MAQGKTTKLLRPFMLKGAIAFRATDLTHAFMRLSRHFRDLALNKNSSMIEGGQIEVAVLKREEDAPAPKGKNPWQEAITEALVVNCIYTKEHDDNPQKAIHDLLSWEIKVALDPAVSADARALIEQGIEKAKADAIQSSVAIGETPNRNARAPDAG